MQPDRGDAFGQERAFVGAIAPPALLGLQLEGEAALAKIAFERPASNRRRIAGQGDRFRLTGLGIG